MARCAHRAWVDRRNAPGCWRGREVENPYWMGSMTTVVLPLAADSGDGLARRPLLCRRQHAEWFGEIEMGGGRSRLPLARNGRWMRPWPVGWPRGRWWPISRPVARVRR